MSLLLSRLRRAGSPILNRVISRNDREMSYARIHANLQEAHLRLAKGRTVAQVMATKNWELAFYSDNFLKELPLKPDHNETLPNRLAKLEKEKKEVPNKR